MEWAHTHRRTVLALGASAAITAGVLALRRFRTSKRNSLATATKPWDAEDEELLKEQLARVIAMFGEESVARIREAFVIVVGVGGVGSHAAHLLVRSGIEKIRLIDFDRVTVSSLNRHAVAVRADVGVSKVEAMRSHLLATCPHAQIEACDTLFSAEKADQLLAGNPTFVLDCIDNLETKVDLIRYCHERSIPFIASMGAGARVDPTRLRIGDISETQEDALARSVRAKLRNYKITEGVPCVFSTERCTVGLLPKGDHIDNAEDFQILKGFRVRIMPVLGTIPAMFGNAMASYVLCELAGKSFEPYPVGLSGSKAITRMYDRVRKREREVFGTKGDTITVSEADVQYLVEDVWRGKSCFSNIAVKLALTRWDSKRPASLTNLILLTESEAKEHDDEGIQAVSQQVREQIEARIRTICDK